MKYYLDEDINIQLTITPAEYFRQNNYSIYKEDELVFNGVTYIPAERDNITINCNDIVSTYKPNYTPSSTGEYPLSNNYTIVLDDSLGGDVSVTFEVVYIYRYPNKDYDYTIDGAILLGDLKPKYPAISTDKLSYGLVSYDINEFCTAPTFNDIYYLLQERTVVTNMPLSSLYVEGANSIVTRPFTSYIVYVNSIEIDTQTADILNSAGIPQETIREILNNEKGILLESDDRDYITYVMNQLTAIKMDYDILNKSEGTPIAYFDECPSRYYLKWIDRKGGIQCQPFKKKDVYSEDISTQTIRNSTGHKRKVFWDITSKWEINSDWLNDEIYPIYESIFTSPYLELYDTEQDKTHPVLLADESYIEKTYKNQKQMFNMTLNLVSDKNQNIYN